MWSLFLFIQIINKCSDINVKNIYQLWSLKQCKKNKLNCFTWVKGNDLLNFLWINQTFCLFLWLRTLVWCMLNDWDWCFSQGQSCHYWWGAATCIDPANRLKGWNHIKNQHRLKKKLCIEDSHRKRKKHVTQHVCSRSKRRVNIDVAFPWGKNWENSHDWRVMP